MITKLEYLRKDRGWTKAALARKAEMQQGTIGLIESKRFVPYESQLLKISKALDWEGNPEDLLKEVNE